jgi:hypothetical protein
LRTLHYRKLSREIGEPINSLGSSKTAKLLYCFAPQSQTRRIHASLLLNSVNY